MRRTILSLLTAAALLGSIGAAPAASAGTTWNSLGAGLTQSAQGTTWDSIRIKGSAWSATPYSGWSLKRPTCARNERLAVSRTQMFRGTYPIYKCVRVAQGPTER